MPGSGEAERTADEALIDDYLQRVGKAARHLPPAWRAS